MPFSGPANFNTVDTSSRSGGTDWTSPSNALYAPDGSAASVNGTSYWLELTGTATIPTNSQAIGIEVAVDYELSGGGLGVNFNYQLIVDGALASAIKTVTNVASQGSLQWGGNVGSPTDSWGIGPISDAKVNAGGGKFGLAFSVDNGGTTYIDSARMTIYYEYGVGKTGKVTAVATPKASSKEGSEGAVSADAQLLASSSASGKGRVGGSVVSLVTNKGSKTAAAQIGASAHLLASDPQAAAAGVRAAATLVMGEKAPTSAHIGASQQAKVTSNPATVHGRIAAAASQVNHTSQTTEGTVRAAATLVSSEKVAPTDYVSTQVFLETNKGVIGRGGAPIEGDVGAAASVTVPTNKTTGEATVAATALSRVLSQRAFGTAHISATALVTPSDFSEALIHASLSLVASSLRAAAGSIGARAAVGVSHNLAAGEGHVSTVAAELASSLLHLTEHLTARATEIANENEGAMAVGAGAHAKVIASSLRAGTGGLSAHVAVIASSRYRASGAIGAESIERGVFKASSAQARATLSVTSSSVRVIGTLAARAKVVASDLISAAGGISASGSAVARGQTLVLHAQLAAHALTVNHLAQGVAGRLTARAAEAVTHNLESAASSIEALAEEFAASRERSGGTSGAHATVVASSLISKSSRLSAAAGVRVPGATISKTAGLTGEHTVVASSLHHGEAAMSFDATVLASSVKLARAMCQAPFLLAAAGLKHVVAGVSAPGTASVSLNKTHGTGRAGAASTEDVPSNLAAGHSTQQGHAVGSVLTNLASANGHVRDSLATAVKANLGHATASVAPEAVPTVTHNLLALAEHLASTGHLTASSVHAATAAIHASAAKIASQVIHALGLIGAEPNEAVLTNLAHAHESLGAMATLVNHIVRAAEAGIISAGHPINHDLLSLAEHLEALATEISHEQGQTGGSGGAHATVIASSRFNGGGGCGAYATVSSPNRQIALVAWVYVEPLCPGSDSACQLLGVQDEDGNYLTTGGPITCVVTDPTGTVIATLTLSYLDTAVTVAGKDFADGNWSATLPGSVSLTAGTTYKLTFQSVNPALQFVRYQTAEERLS